MLHAARMAAYTVGGAPESLAVELEAGEIEVHAEVEVTCVAEPQMGVRGSLEHLEYVHAVRRRDVAAAEEIMRTHIDRTATRVAG